MPGCSASPKQEPAGRGLTRETRLVDDRAVSFVVEFRNVGVEAVAIGSAGPYTLIVDQLAGRSGSDVSKGEQTEGLLSAPVDALQFVADVRPSFGYGIARESAHGDSSTNRPTAVWASRGSRAAVFAASRAALRPEVASASAEFEPAW
jgi:hypothetical protein